MSETLRGALWKKMGSPQNPTPEQIKALEQAGQLKCILTKKLKTKDGGLIIPLKLERQAVALIKLKW